MCWKVDVWRGSDRHELLSASVSGVALGKWPLKRGNEWYRIWQQCIRERAAGAAWWHGRRRRQVKTGGVSSSIQSASMHPGCPSNWIRPMWSEANKFTIDSCRGADVIDIVECLYISFIDTFTIYMALMQHTGIEFFSFLGGFFNEKLLWNCSGTVINSIIFV